jgi:hypothetical protein
MKLSMDQDERWMEIDVFPTFFRPLSQRTGKKGDVGWACGVKLDMGAATVTLTAKLEMIGTRPRVARVFFS